MPKPHTAEQNKNARWTIEELKSRIEKQTGFPAELKVSKIVLEQGWSYVSNPRFADGDGFTEIDLVATIEALNAPICLPLQGGFLLISLAIDVKSYNRPVIIFSSSITDFDSNRTYCDLILTQEKKLIGRRSALLEGLSETLQISVGGRSAVVVNNAGDKSKEFDIHQLSSALKSLYKSCYAVRKDFKEVIEVSAKPEKQFHLNVIVPVIVIQGNIYEYTVGANGGELVERDLVEYHSAFLGHDDQIDECPSYIVRLDFFANFMMKLMAWIRACSPQQSAHYCNMLANEI